MAIIFNITESAKVSAFNIFQEPIKMLLENEIEKFEKGSLLPKIFSMRTMDTFEQEYRSTTTMDGFNPTEDMQPAGLSDFEEGYKKTVRTQIWTNSFAVSKQTLEDNQGMSINPKGVQFIKAYGRTRERYGFAMLAGGLAGFAEFGNKKFDCKGMDTVDGVIDNPLKQNYFHKAHKPLAGVAGGIEQSNMFYKAVDLTAATAAEKLLDVVGMVASKMQNYTDYKGNPLAIEPTRIVMPNHYLMKNKMHVAVQTPLTSEMGDNGINIHYGNWEVIATPYLNAHLGFGVADQAFIMIAPEVNEDNPGAIWIDRVPLEVTSYVENNSKANLWDGRARFGVNFVDFRAMAYVATGATGTVTYENACEALV